MGTSGQKYISKKYSPFRKASADLLQAASRKHMAHALIEVDISEVREAIRSLRREKRTHLSLIGYIVYCTARAVEQNQWVHAYRDWKNKLMAFDEVDVSTTIERKLDGQYEVIPRIIRKANRKSLDEISKEIRHAKDEPMKEAEVYRSIRNYLAIPFLLRRLIFRILDRFPKLMKKKAGTIMVTSAHTTGLSSAWGIPVASHTLNITMGGVFGKVVERDGNIGSREHLCLTVSFDHRITDGAPASRFIRQLTKMIESEIHHIHSTPVTP